MELFSNDFKEMSNSNIKIKLKEIELEYDTIKNELLKLCDKMDELQKIHNIGKEELNKRGL
jgi:hypothetical protein